MLDTCTFYWLIAEPKKLSPKATDILGDDRTEVFLSSISIWELTTKANSGKVKIESKADKLIADSRKTYGLLNLDFTEEDALRNEDLPWVHRDPFDRMLICQALEHGLSILTPDTLIHQYHVRAIW